MSEICMLESMDGKLYLMHEGVSKLNGAPGPGSGRYPLGSGKRPYQNAGPGEQRRARKMGLFGRKKKTLPDEPKESEKEEEKLTDEEKKRIIDEGDIRAAYKNKRSLTNADIEAVILRYNKEKSLADLMPKKKKGIDFLVKSTDVLDKSVKFANASINAWNTIARVNNSLNKNFELPAIYAIGNKDKKNKD